MSFSGLGEILFLKFVLFYTRELIVAAVPLTKFFATFSLLITSVSGKTAESFAFFCV